MPCPNLSDLRFIRRLGGTFRAALVQDDRDGALYVVKAGQTNEHTEEEVLADWLYRAAGIAVPESWLARDPETEKRWRVAAYVAGLTLSQLSAKGDMERIVFQMRAGLPIDLLLGNSDVIGKDGSNVVVDGNGIAWRVDNGAALRWTACEGPKRQAWSPEAQPEAQSWSRRPWHATAYGPVNVSHLRHSCTQLERDGSIDRLMQRAPRDLRETLAARWNSILRFTA